MATPAASSQEQQSGGQAPTLARVIRKRNRHILSCKDCHRRKQKCDQLRPSCANCLRRSVSCEYHVRRPRPSSSSSSENGSSFGVFRQSDPASQVSGFGYTGMGTNTTLGILNRIEGSTGPMVIQSNSVLENSNLVYIEKLVDTYFKEVNYHYYPLDEGLFKDLYSEWQTIPHTTMVKGPQELRVDLQFFPALLFQVLALGLHDVASEYSESGLSILSLLGVRATTLIKVQAGFLRSAYLKNCGMVPEAWHSLSATIRNAQEMGLHKPRTKILTLRENGGDNMERLWEEQLRLRMWAILCLWDIHMAIRVDAPIERLHSDPPTPLTMLIYSLKVCSPLWEIAKLDREDPHQNDLATVKKIHDHIKEIALSCPPWFRAEGYDFEFDANPECYWLPRARQTFVSNSAFTVMALYRPYISTNFTNRTNALEGALSVLRAQRNIFELIKIKDYKIYYILHPNDNRDKLEDALQHFEWGMERFRTMSGYNTMADSALDVINAIYVRLKIVLATANKRQSHPPSNNYYQNVGQSSMSAASSTNGTQYTQPTISNMTDSISGSTPISSSWDGSGMAAIHDPQMVDYDNWQNFYTYQFGGEFAEDSFWGHMNSAPYHSWKPTL
ncbi:hypothetical protein B0O99DRAFT_612241 [Bisporella sp. PMI_857]|nr:hypothetical protein B0O99DRAFT_612241 [Bisporella sp. PMI_857]